MSPLKHSNNIAARMGRWSASHWKTAVFGWLAFVVVAFGIATQLPMKTISTQDQNVGQAHRADEIFKKSGFGQTDSQTEFVVIQSKTLTVNSGAFRAAIAERLVITLRAVEKHVTSIFSKLRLPATAEDHRRVLAVLTYLDSSS